jgi:predicted kinase
VPEYRDYEKWYHTKRWERKSKLQLKQFPLCVYCQKTGQIVPATVADHIEPHKGDYQKFWFGELQSLCWSHHSSAKAKEEYYGYKRDIGADGWPIDPRHPANRKNFSVPFDLEPSGIPVTLVCGPPASGKSTYVQQHKEVDDTVISLDECKVAVGGRCWDQDKNILRRAFLYRDNLLHGLAQRRSGRAWLIVGAPTQQERDAWCAVLGQCTVVVLDVEASICVERIRNDPARKHALPELVAAVTRWYLQANTSRIKVNQ